MSNVLDPFLLNLSKTCSTDNLVREDGKALRLLDKIICFVSRKRFSHHFVSSCKKLQNYKESEIQQLSLNDRLEILGRLRRIQSNLTNVAEKVECEKLIDNFETKAFPKTKKERQEILQLVSSSFENLEESAQKRNAKKLNAFTHKIETIIDHCSEDTSILKGVIERTNIVLAHQEKKRTSNRASTRLQTSCQSIRTKLLFQLENELKSKGSSYALEQYPQLLSSYLIAEYNNNHVNEIAARLSSLKSLMDKYSDDKEFIASCIGSIDNFLTQTVFSERYSLSEKSKGSLLVAFKEIFPLVNTYIKDIDDPELALQLKIKCSNLPCATSRSKYPETVLSENEQLEALLNGLQSKEEKSIQSLIVSLEAKKRIPQHDVSRLAKLVSREGESGLSHENLMKLREALLLGSTAASLQWDNLEAVREFIVNNYEIQTESKFVQTIVAWFKKRLKIYTKPQPTLIESIARNCKAKTFFSKQLGIDESLIHIPRWYHATNHAFAIIQSGHIEVRHQKLFKGAWVSDEREPLFGSYTLALSHRISKLDSKPFIGFQYDAGRWRGVQKNIKLINGNASKSNLSVVGIPNQIDKTAQKVDKARVIQTLKNSGLPQTVVMSSKQLDYVQSEVKRILGDPNLSSDWWGKGSPYSDHQLKIHDTIQSMNVSTDQFAVTGSRAEDQTKISEIVQSFALPLYKQPMPQVATYRNKKTNMRVELSAQSDKQYKEHVDHIHAGLKPSRGHHGTMHSTRAVLWSQVLLRAYERMGITTNANPILLATATAYHDVARENEFIDRWDEESAQALGMLLQKAGIDEETTHKHVQAVEEKDPQKNRYSTFEQQIVHDADCLEIVRVIGKYIFKSSNLCISKLIQNQQDKNFYHELIQEIFKFIEITDDKRIINLLEHSSDDYYGDLVRVLFAMQRQNPSLFPHLTGLIREDMEEILSIETDVSRKLLEITYPSR